MLAVVGPVGSGKVNISVLGYAHASLFCSTIQSSLLQCLLRELQPLDGSVDIEGTVTYASQEPWIFSGTLRENIIFGQPFDQAWFNRVVECCCLVKVESCHVTYRGFIDVRMYICRILKICHLVMRL